MIHSDRPRTIAWYVPLYVNKKFRAHALLLARYLLLTYLVSSALCTLLRWLDDLSLLFRSAWSGRFYKGESRPMTETEPLPAGEDPEEGLGPW